MDLSDTHMASEVVPLLIVLCAHIVVDTVCTPFASDTLADTLADGVLYAWVQMKCGDGSVKYIHGKRSGALADCVLSTRVQIKCGAG